MLFLVPGAVFAVIVLLTRVSGTNLRSIYRTGRVPGETSIPITIDGTAGG